MVSAKGKYDKLNRKNEQYGGLHAAREFLMRNVLTLVALELNDPHSPNGRKQRGFLRVFVDKILSSEEKIDD